MARHPTLCLSGDIAADRFLSKDPLALVIGMVLDQQIPLERAFAAPEELRQRLDGTFDAATLASMDPEKLAAVFSIRPALHRFPASMAARVQAACKVIIDSYGGRAEKIWTTAKTGDELFERVKALPGFGEQKARIFVALLGKQLGVDPPGWQTVSSPFGEKGSFRSVADIVDAASLGKVRAFKMEMKAAAKMPVAAKAGKVAKAAKVAKSRRS